MSPWDQQISRAINGLAGESLALDTLGRVLVGDYFVPVLLALWLLGLWFGVRDPAARERHQRAVLVAILAVLVANLLVLALNMTPFGMRSRPFAVDTQAARTTDTLFYRPTDPTFPSNSTAVAFAIAAAVGRVNRRVGIPMALLGVGLGLARVYVGVHYLSDVLGGIAVGIVSSLIALAFLRIVEPVPSLFLRWARRFYLA